MGQHQHETRRRRSIILDAGYISIRPNDASSSSSIFVGLHGRKLVCVIGTTLLLFLASLLNLTCLMWIMYQLDWSPFHSENGSQIFRFDRVTQQLELHQQGRFQEPIYTTTLRSASLINCTSGNQMDIYGDHNSILLDENQISMNTESFSLKSQPSLDFSNLQNFKFDPNKRVRVHLERLNTQHIHFKTLHLMSHHHMVISNVNRAFFSSQNLTLAVNRYDRQSVIRFNNHPTRRKSTYPRQKVTHANLNFRSESMFFDLKRLPLLEDPARKNLNAYRLCICNTTFLLLRSFAHQPCPLC